MRLAAIDFRSVLLGLGDGEGASLSPSTNLRFSARTRAGADCQAPVHRKRRCRLHGGTNPGAPIGNRDARKHGVYSANRMGAKQYLKMIARLERQMDCCHWLPPAEHKGSEPLAVARGFRSIGHGHTKRAAP